MPEEEKREHREFVIFVDKVEEKWSEPQVLAGTIMERAGTSDPQTHILEALDGPHGEVVKEFKSNETVDLRENDRKFFHVTAGGGGYS
ncbi:MAG: hypothetical protein JRN35_05130 [Nitrososphaerota archaeon]|jgi:hypothetical protein|nr:hypothetical protein [Nitrososphaerota archaeon]MDG6949751.1 hypothetical protein [Nitrososphaerota archaeon]